MLTLVTTNAAKYAPFRAELERLRVKLQPPPQVLPELQSLSFGEALGEKAKAFAAMFGRPVLVDDAGLVLEAYAPFPGPLTSTVVRNLGAAGLGRLLTGVSPAASMECHLGCWVEGSLRHWSGVVAGHMDSSRPPRDSSMPLSDWFIPNGETSPGLLLHRARALAAFAADAFDLHLILRTKDAHYEPACAVPPGYQCPFCVELEGDGPSIFNEFLRDRLPSRILYEDDWFVVVPPLGQFMEGGLLLLTRAHIPSFAHLPAEQFQHLERLLCAINKVSIAHWGVSPLVFEHGSALEYSKGRCCVDHAHLNIFPAKVKVQAQLTGRMHLSLASLSDLSRLRPAEFGYLFVQENDGTCYAYDGQYAPSQLVRRIITAHIGCPQRWHWRDYAGCDELLATYHKLKGQIRL